MKRRLIVCCDGTWQDLEQENATNVVKMAQAIKPVDNSHDQEIHQILYYDEGIGAKTKSFARFKGGAFGFGIDHKIEEAYCFLSMNYQPSDEIYLFGFSRGAYTVRSLAGLIYNCGLLHRENIRRIPEAYEIYRKQDQDNAPHGINAIDFRNQYGRQVPIKALCCWDTVGSLGIPDLSDWMELSEQFNERHRFHNTEINPTIEKAFHAVAIDEIRKVFDVTPMSSDRSEQVVEVWFPGDHGCVGGGQEECGLSDAGLLWMMEQVEALGLALDTSHVQPPINPKHTAPFDNKSKWPFNEPRKFDGDLSHLHESVKNRWKDLNDSKSPYQPAIPAIGTMLEQELGALKL